MTTMNIEVEQWPLKKPFSISYHTWHERETLVVTLSEDGSVGRGEGNAHPKYTESLSDAANRLMNLRTWIEGGAQRNQVFEELPPGPAKNALDAALWDLEAKRTRKTAWEIAGIPEAPRLQTVMTIGIGSAAEMREAAHQVREYPILKIKLDQENVFERMDAVVDASPDADYVIDANEAWSIELLADFCACYRHQSIKLIEQPLERGHDQALENFTSPIALCADESFQDIRDMDDMARRYQVINIKLDKIGGLTAALLAAREAKNRNLKLMVGCMGGTSLSMAPAYLLGSICDVVDLDAPLLLSQDRANGLIYNKGRVEPPASSLWG